MSGGLMQLVAYGAQDVYLSGNPNITFWKVVYRRHTNFATETIEQTFSGNPDFGRRVSSTIVRNGDLARCACLMVTVDSVSWTPNNGANLLPSFAWVRRLGHALIKNVECNIGGSRIDKQYGVWLDLWYELTHDVNQERAYRAMIGDVEELTALSQPNANGNVKDAYTLYVPLQFWFCRNSGLALPLIALQYHEVRLDFEFEDVNKLIVWQTDDAGSLPPIRDLHMKEASVLVDYVYLDSVERRRFAQVGHEYLIEQVQFTGEETLTGNQSTSIQYRQKMSFNHPTKELIWAVRNASFVGDSRTATSTGVGHPFLCYTHDDNSWDAALTAAANNLANGMLQLAVNASPVAVSSPLTTAVVQLAIGAGGVVSANVPTSSTHNVRLNVFVNGTLTNGVVNVNRYALYAGVPTVSGASVFNFADYLDDIQVNVDYTAGPATILATVISHRLNLTDVSVPTDSANLNDNRYNNTANGNPNDVVVIQPHNYGLRLDGKGNPVSVSGLQLNGQERFDPRLSGYFNYVQPHCHHTRTPADGINVYAFGLHPEQHQPSGTCNLSRIDTATLNLTLTDPLRNAFGTASPLRIDVSDATLWTFAFNYNILRVLSGMAGVAYSN